MFTNLKTVPELDRLLPMVSTVSKDGPLIFKVADRAKVNDQSCKLKSRAANVDLTLTDPQCIHLDEFLRIDLEFEIKDHFSTL